MAITAPSASASGKPEIKDFVKVDLSIGKERIRNIQHPAGPSMLGRRVGRGKSVYEGKAFVSCFRTDVHWKFAHLSICRVPRRFSRSWQDDRCRFPRLPWVNLKSRRTSTIIHHGRRAKFDSVEDSLFEKTGQSHWIRFCYNTSHPYASKLLPPNQFRPWSIYKWHVHQQSSILLMEATQRWNRDLKRSKSTRRGR